MVLEVNNTWLLESLVAPKHSKRPATHERQPSSFVLLRRLPLSSQLEKTAASAAKRAKRDRILQHSLATALETPLDAPTPTSPPKVQRHDSLDRPVTKKGVANSAGASNADGSFEAFHVLRAVERKVGLSSGLPGPLIH
jgi:hypothetical protein